MELRIARHTSDLNKIRSFYTGILGFDITGSFENHDGYNGIFISKPGLGWHFEFTENGSVSKSVPDGDDAIVLYPETEQQHQAMLSAISIAGVEFKEPKNPYWKKNGKMILDPDGFPLIISPQRIKIMKKVRITGVPEHFNYPWQLCLKEGEFERSGIDLQWTNIPEGTGKMCQMLHDGETDIAVILTEGIVKDIVGGNPSKIVQVYVESPLLWGIHVAGKSNFKSLGDLEGATAAISRLGSGSQLMAYINAANQGWKISDLKFEIVNTIDGAVEALTEGRADYFMWERFMTKPLVDQGIFRRLGDCPTPWPCFVIAVRDEFLESNPETVRIVLEIINSKTSRFRSIPGIAEELASTFSQKTNDIHEWLSLTKWSQAQLSPDVLNNVQNQLLALSLIDKKATFTEIVKA